MSFLPFIFHHHPLRDRDELTVRFSLFSCTSLLYYNLCLCKSFKELSPYNGSQCLEELSRGASLPVCDCKGRWIPWNTQVHRNLFFQKTANFMLLPYIYITRVRAICEIRMWYCEEEERKGKERREETVVRMIHWTSWTFWTTWTPWTHRASWTHWTIAGSKTKTKINRFALHVVVL